MVTDEPGKATSFSKNSQKPVYLVSACLVGLCTRYDAQVKSYPKCFDMLQEALWVPVCPEQLGGLPTPRTPADLVGGDGYDVISGKARVVDRDGRDVTEKFLTGAHQVLEIARKLQVRSVLFKSKSPSCGLAPQTGVTAALLRLNNIEVQEIG
ncbi:MAG: DUF523 domain-containing protein [Desulfobulbaceae bacterium]|uniref:DUF523 domain-containing protein n=1 Tax=Candidatus Desulfobia pelagia TaxID=2841692 RepID=A0A8J6TCB5_9BACT|nr:DUF523 domain-containing protein [Candidatus Desulfobia pelagia]